MESVPKDIKALLAKNAYEEALTACDKLGSVESFELQSVIARCCLELQREERAGTHLEKCLKLNPPPNQVQKIWKSLSDIYEKTENYTRLVECYASLYDITTKKGNVERSLQLAESSALAYIKDAGYKAGFQWLLQHINLMKAQCGPEHLMVVLSSMADMQSLHLQQLEEAKRKAPRTLGTKPKEDPPEEWLAPTKLMDLVAEILDGKGPTDSSAILELYLRNANTKRAEALKNKDWDGLYSECTRMLQSHSSAWSTPIFDILVEAWIFESKSTKEDTTEAAENFMQYVHRVLEKDETNVPANISKAIMHLQHGEYRSSRAYANVCTKRWNSDLVALKAKESAAIANQTAPSSSSSSSSTTSAPTTTMTFTTLSTREGLHSALCLFVSVIQGSFDGFRSLTPADMLHATEDALRKEKWIFQNVGPLGFHVRELVRLARLKSFAAIEEYDTLVAQAVVTLPHYFGSKKKSEVCMPVDDDSGSDSAVYPRGQTGLHLRLSALVNNGEVLVPVSVAWLSLQIIKDVGEYTQAGMAVDAMTKAVSEVDNTHTEQCAGSSVDRIHAKSWLLLEKAHTSLLESIRSLYERKMSGGLCAGPSRFSFLGHEDVLGDTTGSAIVRNFQAVLKCTDAFSSEIDADTRIHMGIAMWMTGGKLRKDKNGCIAYLLAGAKADPTHPRVFAFIGHYYQWEQADANRAIKCYEKALVSDPLNREAGYGLTYVLLKSGQIERAMGTLENIEGSTQHAGWCSAMKARVFLAEERFEDAVEPLQRSLELDVYDGEGWYLLGQSYANLRQYTAAEKAFLRARELAPSDGAVLCGLGNSQRKLCLLADSLKSFEAALRIDADDRLALKGLADVYLLQAYMQVAQGWRSGAAYSVMKGRKYADKLIHVYETHSEAVPLCVYKLYGDMCAFSYHIGPRYMTFAKSIEGANGSMHKDCNLLDANISSESESALPGLLADAEDTYRKMVKILEASLQEIESRGASVGDTERVSACEELSASLCDVGMALYYQASYLQRCAGQGSGLISSTQIFSTDVRTKFLSAKGAFRRSLDLNVLNSVAWNGLGLVYDNDTASEACFVRATQIDQNPSAYANLGLLLLGRRDDDKAKECFSALQLIESNPLVWTNLGIIFERSAGQDASSHGTKSDQSHQTNLRNKISQTSWRQDQLLAYDSYIAALEVAKPSEALMGSALTWLRLSGYTRGFTLADVCNEPEIGNSSNVDTPNSSVGSIYDIHQVKHEVEVKLDLFLQCNPVHPLAWLLYGWCLERRRNYNGARKCAVRVLQTANAIYKRAKHSAVLYEGMNTVFERVISSGFSLYRRAGIKFLSAEPLSPLSAVITCEDLDFCFTDLHESFGMAVDLESLRGYVQKRYPFYGNDERKVIVDTTSWDASRYQAERLLNAGKTNVAFEVTQELLSYIVLGLEKNILQGGSWVQRWESLMTMLYRFVEDASPTNTDVSGTVVDLLRPILEGDHDGENDDSGTPNSTNHDHKHMSSLHKQCATHPMTFAVYIESCRAVRPTRLPEDLSGRACMTYPSNAYMWLLKAEAHMHCENPKDVISAAESAEKSIDLCDKLMASSRAGNDGVGLVSLSEEELENHQTDALCDSGTVYCRAVVVLSKIRNLQPDSTASETSPCNVEPSDDTTTASTQRNDSDERSQPAGASARSDPDTVAENGEEKKRGENLPDDVRTLANDSNQIDSQPLGDDPASLSIDVRDEEGGDGECDGDDEAARLAAIKRKIEESKKSRVIPRKMLAPVKRSAESHMLRALHLAPWNADIVAEMNYAGRL